MENANPVTFTYKNWQGKTAKRKVFPLQIWFGKTDWHPQQQWFLKAFDFEKANIRDFAIADISGWTNA